MVHQTTAIIVAKTLTLVFGGAITFFAYRAYSRTGSPSLRALALGFALVTTGAILAGVMDQLSPIDFRLSILVESLLTLVGFAIITYSLYAE